MSRFAKILKQFEGDTPNAYQRGRGVRFTPSPDITDPSVRKQVNDELRKYAGDRDYRVYNDLLRFGDDKAFDTAVNRQAFMENKDLLDYYRNHGNKVVVDGIVGLKDDTPIEQYFQKAISWLQKQESNDPETWFAAPVAIKQLKKLNAIDFPDSYYVKNIPDLLNSVNDQYQKYLASISNSLPVVPEISDREMQARALVNQIAEKDIYTIDKALRTMPENVDIESQTYKGAPVQRGYHFDTEDARTQFLNSVLEGEWKDPDSGMAYWRDPAFHSVTTAPNIAQGFAAKRKGEYPVVIDYNFGRLDSQYPRVTKNTKESESIFPPDTYFEVYRHWKEGDIDRLELAPVRGNPRGNRLFRSITPNSYSDRMMGEMEKARESFYKYQGIRSGFSDDGSFFDGEMKWEPEEIEWFENVYLNKQIPFKDFISQYKISGTELSHEDFAQEYLGIEPNYSWKSALSQKDNEILSTASPILKQQLFDQWIDNTPIVDMDDIEF